MYISSPEKDSIDRTMQIAKKSVYRTDDNELENSDAIMYNQRVNDMLKTNKTIDIDDEIIEKLEKTITCNFRLIILNTANSKDKNKDLASQSRSDINNFIGNSVHICKLFYYKIKSFLLNQKYMI